MASKNITYGDLEWLLTEVGFRAGSTTGHHRFFEYLTFDSVIVLPGRQPDESVDPAHLIAVRKNLTEKGIIEASVFDAMLATRAKLDDQQALLTERA
jgi:hypothetical protein